MPDLSELLRERGMRVTSQRLLIDRALRDHGGHLTAEQVHELVEPVLPGVTQQTVYSTLALLADLGVAQRVAAPGSSTRFEAPNRRSSSHGLRALRRYRGPPRAGADVARGRRRARARASSPPAPSVTVLGLCAACRPLGAP